MPIRPRRRPDRLAADRVLSNCRWSTVCCWQPPNVYGLEIAAFLELHEGAKFEAADDVTVTGNVGAVRFAYRNHKPFTIRFTRSVTADAATTIISARGKRRQLSMLPARANCLPYCEDIVPDRVYVWCEDVGDHVFISLGFVAPDEFVRSAGEHELALRFPETSDPRQCPCC